MIHRDIDLVEAIEKFKNQNIEVKRTWKPLHLQKSFRGTKFFGKGACVELWNKGLCLPSGKVGEGDVKRIIDVLKSVFK